MCLNKYFIALIFLIVHNGYNYCLGQANSAELAGPQLPAINTQVSYYPIFKDVAGNVLSADQVGVVDIWYGYNVFESGPGPIVSQSGINFNVTWRTLGYCEIECTINTWDNYIECSPYALTVQEQAEEPEPPLPVISVSGYVIPVGGAVTLAINNFVYDSYQWLDVNGVSISGANTSILNVTLPGVYKVRAVKGTKSVVSYEITITSVENLKNTNYVVTNDIKQRIPTTKYILLM